MTDVSAVEMLVVSTALLALWVPIDMLLTGRTPGQRRASLELALRLHGARCTAGALRELATNQGVVESLRSHPAETLRAIADGIERGAAEIEAA